MHRIDSNSFCFRHVITRCSISTCTNPFVLEYWIDIVFQFGLTVGKRSTVHTIQYGLFTLFSNWRAIVRVEFPSMFGLHYLMANWLSVSSYAIWLLAKCFFFCVFLLTLFTVMHVLFHTFIHTTTRAKQTMRAFSKIKRQFIFCEFERLCWPYLIVLCCCNTNRWCDLDRMICVKKCSMIRKKIW